MRATWIRFQSVIFLFCLTEATSPGWLAGVPRHALHPSGVPLVIALDKQSVEEEYLSQNK